MGDVQVQVETGELGPQAGPDLPFEVSAAGALDRLKSRPRVKASRAILPFGVAPPEGFTAGFRDTLGPVVRAGTDNE